MIKRYLNAGNYQYCAEFIPYDECIEKHNEKFVMLRNFTLMNDIACDNNIYIIEKELFNEYKNGLIEGKENVSLVFPTNTTGMHYSTYYNIFNDTFIDKDITNELSVYDIYEKLAEYDEQGNMIDCSFSPKQIRCDVIKLYHPHIKTNNNFVVHVENYINNIHFHYICNTYEHFTSHSNSEHRHNNNIYSEYIELHIPQITDLFDRTVKENDKDNIVYDYSTYYKENLNIIDIVDSKNLEFLSNIIIMTNGLDRYVCNINNEYIDKYGNVTSPANQYVPMAMFTQPFKIIHDKESNTFKKQYLKYKFVLENNYITTPINLTLFPYDTIDDSNKVYLLDANITPATCSFYYDYKFTVNARCCFGPQELKNVDDKTIINHLISLDVAIDYPDKQYFDEVFGDNALEEAYCFYHHIVDKNIYKNTKLYESYKEELDEISILDDEELKEKRMQSFIEEYIDEYKVDIDFFGFRIVMASDKKFKHIIYESNISILDPSAMFTEDGSINVFKNLKRGIYTFPINTIFNDWAQLPENIICKVTFIDRYIGNEIESNSIVITKEKFKYMTNNYGPFRLEDILTPYNEAMREIDLNTEKNIRKEAFDCIVEQIDNETIRNELNEWYRLNSVSFVNNINCIISQKEEKSEYSSSNTTSQIIYKPIFYKVNDINTVKIKNNQNQNIAIDLHEYMAKVDSFIMVIDNEITLYEIGRNANFVLFNVNALKLNGNSGSFNIFNQDEEYITTGTWSIV